MPYMHGFLGLAGIRATKRLSGARSLGLLVSVLLKNDLDVGGQLSAVFRSELFQASAECFRKPD